MPSMNATTSKPRTSRKAKAPLPPTLAHELDIARAARMGIDISHMQPDERCKYPSKFCCHQRARKSTGKLHRFCEEHRSRANINQKRWIDVRRRHESAKAIADAGLALCAEDAWMDVCERITTPRDVVSKASPPSPSTVETLYESDLPLSEDDIDFLTSMVASSAHSFDPLVMEDAWLVAMLQEVEPPVVTPSLFDDLAIGAL